MVKKLVLVSLAILASLTCMLGTWVCWPDADLHGTSGTPVSASESDISDVAPGWRNLFGPTHDNNSAERQIISSWPDSGPQEQWRVSVGTGYSSPVVSDTGVVVMHRQNDRELIECRAWKTGETIWQFDYATTYHCQYEYSDGPYSTPVMDDDRVYALGAQGQFHCLDLGTGQQMWRRMLHDDYQVEEGLFAAGSSPLLVGDRLILSLGGRDTNAGIIALDKHNGETVWTATDHGASYATPCAATIHGRRYVFVITFEGLVALDPDDGTVHWHLPFRSRKVDSVNATSPLVDGDLVLMVTGPGPGSVCVRILPDGGYEEVWRHRRNLDSQFNSLVCRDGFVYGYSSKRIGASFRCIELSSGELRWKWSSDLMRGSAIAVDGKFILWGEHGHLAVLEVDPRRARPLGITPEPLLASPCYASPALHRGRLYLRNDNTLLCLDLRRES